MKKRLALISSVTLTMLSAVTPAVGAEDETTVKGEVVQVQQHVRTSNDGEFDQLRIRTRQGEELQLRLGRSDSCPGCVQVGDQVRARVRGAGQGQVGQVQSMKVRRNGSMYTYQVRNGELLQGQGRLRARDGSGTGRGNGQGWSRQKG